MSSSGNRPPARRSTNVDTGILSTVPPTIDPNLKLARTREGIVGIDHQMVSNIHATVDYIYRYYDQTVATYALPQSGLPDRAAAIAQVAAASALWVPTTIIDPNTGISSALLHLPGRDVHVCRHSARTPKGNTSFTTNANTYNTYQGIQLTIAKRLSNRWQGNLSYTWNDYGPSRRLARTARAARLSATPAQHQGGSLVQFTSGYTNNTPLYAVKAYASLDMAWGIQAGMNLQIQDGDVRTPDHQRAGRGAQRHQRQPGQHHDVQHADLRCKRHASPAARKLVDLNVRKGFRFGKQDLILTLDAFNVFNTGTTLGFSSNNTSLNGQNGTLNSFNSISSIVPPRVFRFDASFRF